MVDYQQVPASLVPVPDPVGPYQGRRLILQTNHIPREPLPLRMELNTIIPHDGGGAGQYGWMINSSTNSLHVSNNMEYPLIYHYHHIVMVKFYEFILYNITPIQFIQIGWYCEKTSHLKKDKDQKITLFCVGTI